MTEAESSADAPATGPPMGVASAQTRLRLALDAAEMGLWDWDIVTGELVWDDRSAEMYGTSLAASTGSIMDVEARVHPDDLEQVRQVLRGAIDTVGVVDVEFRVRWPDGTIRWLYGRGQALPDERGQAVRLIGTNVDVTDQRQAVQQQASDARRMAGLVAIAHALGDAQDEADVLRVVTGRGAALIGAQGVVLCLVAPGDRVRALSTGVLDEGLRALVAELPADSPVRVTDASSNGASHFLADWAAATARFPEASPLHEEGRPHGSAAVPLRVRGQFIGSLSVAFAAPYVWRTAECELLEAFAALTAQAVDRIQARQAEHHATREVQRMAETLQRSLLTSPPVVAGMSMAVRYQPATEQAQVGGDWYDAFIDPAGSLVLVIGDVAGHDQDAAAAMAQVRNITRGVAQTLAALPAATLSALDCAMHHLGLSALATAVLCQVDAAASGDRVLRWSNAGHPPPLLLHADGATELLTSEPDLLLGLDMDTGRVDHVRPLPPGTTLLLYTDGLVERRGLSIDDGLAALQGAVEGLHDTDVELLCDAVLSTLAAGAADDIALLALRVT